jgi:hypothetical protein
MIDLITWIKVLLGKSEREKMEGKGESGAGG